MTGRTPDAGQVILWAAKESPVSTFVGKVTQSRQVPWEHRDEEIDSP